MSGGDPPPDNSLAVEQSRQQAAKEAQAVADAKEAAHKAELGTLRGNVRSGAAGDVGNYFSSRGLDPSQYQGSIDSELNRILNSISPTDENPGASFSGAGQNIYDTLQTGARTKAGSDIDRTFGANYATTRAPMTLDDSYWSGYEGEQYADADRIIQNMLDRGVLTSSGYSSAHTDLDNQRAGVRSRLNTIGNDLVAGEQSALNDIIGTARTTAGNLTLGTPFDTGSYVHDADQSFNTFLSGLGDSIRAGAPGKLFKTGGLAAIGGAGQGAGNTAFNPDAAAGVVKPKDDDTEDQTNTIF